MMTKVLQWFLIILFLPGLTFSQLPVYERRIKMPAISGNCEIEIGDKDATGKTEEVPCFYSKVKTTLLGKAEGADVTGLIEIDHGELNEFYLSVEKEKVKAEAGDIYLEISELTADSLNLRGLNLERKDTDKQLSLFLGKTAEAEEDVFAQYGGGIRVEFYPKQAKIGFLSLSFLDDKSSVNLPNLSPISSNVFSFFGSTQIKEIGSVESELAISSFDPDKRKDNDAKKDMAMAVKLTGGHRGREMELSYNQIGKDYKTAVDPYLLSDKETFGIKLSQPIKEALLTTGYEKGKESDIDLKKIEVELADMALLGIVALSGYEAEQKKQKSKSTKIYLELEGKIRRLNLSPAYELTSYDDEVIDSSDYNRHNLTLGIAGDIGSVTLSSNIGYSFSSKGPGKKKEDNYTQETQVCEKFLPIIWKFSVSRVDNSSL
jgi:hypothetical protein